MSTAIGTLGKLNKIPARAKSKNTSFWQAEKTRSLGIKIGILLIVIGTLGLGSYEIAKANTGKILPRVQIAGIKVGGKTPAEAKKIVLAYVTELNANGPQLTYNDQKIDSKLPDMGVTFDVNAAVNDAYSFGRSGSVKTRILDNAHMTLKSQNINLDPKLDNAKLDGFLGQITKTVEIEPVNAGLAVDQNGNISVTPPKNGRGVDKNKLKTDLTALINKHQTSGKIALVTSDLTPQVLEAGTTDAKAQAQKYMASAPITLTYNDKTFTATKADIGSWISFAPSGNKLIASVSADKIGVFAGWVGKQVEIAKVDREIMEGTGQVLEEGHDGVGMDSKRLVSDLKDRVSSQSPGGSIAIGTFLIAKGEVTKNPHAQPCRYDGHYVDVNLSEQTLYAFDGCNLVNQFLISGGLTGPTPTGEFHVYSKSRVTRMTGPGYDLPGVEWVSWFSGDYSIHGTYWHNNFGHPMSHGCVNASNGDAEWLYGWDDVGTPVYIHY